LKIDTKHLSKFVSKEGRGCFGLILAVPLFFGVQICAKQFCVKSSKNLIYRKINILLAPLTFIQSFNG